MLDFEENMKEMKKVTPNGFKDMLVTHPKHWCRAYFNTKIKYDIVDNNLVEALGKFHPRYPTFRLTITIVPNF